jgi:hypothetical protein
VILSTFGKRRGKGREGMKAQTDKRQAQEARNEKNMLMMYDIR